jgi:outer membrane protein OmpA-like peptidoglycan-associated protein
MKNKLIASALTLMLMTLGVNDGAWAQVRKKGAPAAKKPTTAIPTTSVVNEAKSKSQFSKVGDRFFVREEYFKAAEEYRKGYNADPKDNYCGYMLAESYRMYFDYPSAEKYYGLVSENNGAQEFPLVGYWHASMLKINGKYAAAEAAFTTFAGNFRPVNPADKIFIDQARTEAAGCALAVAESTKKLPDYKFGILPKGVNTEYSDYAAAPFQHDTMIVFTSSRPRGSKNINDPRTGARFSDLFVYTKKGANWEESNNSDLDGLNTRVNDGAGVFNLKRTKYYYTSCGADEPCQIMVTEYTGGSWSSPKALNEVINLPGSASKQPAISVTGDTIYFVSDRPGGLGLNDIWMSTKKPGTELWLKATNLGKNINTPYQEVSPAVGPEGLLFFASNGREGIGGLDVFMSENRGNGKVTNLGYPFNSNRDDFGFLIGARLGYLSSNRDGGQGNDDIYLFDIYNADRSVKNAILNKEEIANRKPQPEPEGPIAAVTEEAAVDVTGTVKDGDKPVENAVVDLKDEKDKVIETTTTDKDGAFKFKNLKDEKDKKYKPVIAARKPKPEPKTVVKKATKPNADHESLQLADVAIKKTRTKVTRFLFENIYFDFDGDTLRPEARKTLDELIDYSEKNPHIQVELNASTDNLGESTYNRELSERRADAAKLYLLNHGLKKTSLVVRALGEGAPLTGNDNPAGRTLNRRVEFFIRGGYEYTGGAMAYVPETDDQYSNIASQFGMTTDEIQALNATTSEVAKAYNAVRVKRKVGGKVVAPVSMALSKKAKPDLLPELEGRPVIEKKKAGVKK